MRSSQPERINTSASSAPPPLRDEAEAQDRPPPESEFKVSFQFVRSDDAQKALNQKRSHVMREYRRRERWEHERKKRQMKRHELPGENRPPVKVESYRLDAGRKLTAEPMGSQLQYDAIGPTACLEPQTGELACQKFQISSTPLCRFTSDVAILDSFTDRFVDAFAPAHHTNCGSSNTVRTAAAIRISSPLLHLAFNAVSTAFVGHQTCNMDIAHTGRSLYAQVLKSLQSALSHSIHSKSDSLLATVVLLVAYESMQHTTRDALRVQSAGVLRLIEHRGPYRHVRGLGHLCFSELRPYWAFASLVLRKPSFLSKPEWKSIPWSSAGTSKDIMQHLVDHIVDISTLLYEFDMQSASSKKNSAPNQASPKQHMLWQSISDVESGLHRWKREWADEYPEGQPREEAPGNEHTFPTFKYRDPSTDKIVTPPILIYPDPQLCRCLCTYWASMIVIFSIDTRSRRAIKPQHAFQWASCICRSIQYFILNVPGNMTNRMAFPLAAAHGALPKDGIERKFIEEVNKVIERRKVSKVFGTIRTG